MVTDWDTMRAAPATISGKVKKNGLATPPVRATSIAAPVRPTDPSTMNLAEPRAFDGSSSLTRMRNIPANASRMRMACWFSGQSVPPMVRTMIAVTRMKIQLVTRTTWS